MPSRAASPPRRIRAVAAAAGGVALWLLAAATAAAQPAPAVVDGVVRDTAGRGLPAVEVLAPGTARRTRTDSLGRFTLAGLPGDTVRVVARLIGHLAGDVRLALQPGMRVSLAITMVPVPVRLPGVTVAERAPDPGLTLQGFYERQAKLRGVFLDPAYFEGREAVQAGILFDELPVAARTRCPGAGRIGLGDTSPCTVLMRQLLRGGYCAPDIWIDGKLRIDAMLQGARIAFVDTELEAGEVVGLEVYERWFHVPKRFRRPGVRDCGAIAVWTRRAQAAAAGGL